MKKILGLSIAALLVIGLAGAGTWAYFSDVETASDNVLTAGTLDLKIGETGSEADDNIVVVSISNAVPGDSSSNYTSLKYSGTVTDNYIGIEIDAVNEDGGTSTEPEVSAGDAGNAGNLGDLVEIAFWIDTDGNGWDEGDYYLTDDDSGWAQVAGGPSPASVPMSIIDNFAEEIGTEYKIDADMADNEAWDFYIAWNFPEGGDTDNKCQGDTADIDIIFTMQQGDPS